MTAQSVEFIVGIAEFDAEAWKLLKAAREEVSKLEKSISESFVKSDRFRAIRNIAGINDYASKYSVMPPHISGGNIVARTLVNIPDATKTYQPGVNLGEKTINTLLSGKLLTDEQKKALIKRLGVDLDTIVEGGAA